jgi:hypothetical protein
MRGLKESRRWSQLVAGVAIILVGTLCGCYPERYLPRMRNQPSVKPFEGPTTLMPPGVVPRDGGEVPVAADKAAALASPLPANDDNRAAGKTYYGWYCLMCHGSDGSGNTQVGGGYDPAPTDLRSERVRAMTDGELFRAMVVGKGHETDRSPVLRLTVPEDRRWKIVLHLRTLGE